MNAVDLVDALESGHIAGAGLDVGRLAVHDDRPQRDAGVHVAAIVKIPHGPGIRTAPVRLELATPAPPPSSSTGPGIRPPATSSVGRLTSIVGGSPAAASLVRHRLRSLSALPESRSFENRAFASSLRRFRLE